MKTSLANLVRLCEPPLVLDEGHKATSLQTRQALADMNISAEIQLSATPPEDANVLSRVSGRELLDEEMIKLPINVVTSNETSWRDCLARANDQRRLLSREAAKHYTQSGKYIRPIVLVQVERTGKAQRDAAHIHSEAVREYLVQQLGVAPTAIAVKSAQKDEIPDNLLAEGCRIEWIITKAALQEGWDCPFAYILVSLSAGKSKVAMTQLVGRILRQPNTERTALQALDESYIYCLRRSATDVVKEVKRALEKEGYEGDLHGVVDTSGPKATQEGLPVARIRTKFKKQYLRPFAGRIFLPRFCVKDGADYEPLDYFAHLISRVDVGAFDYERVREWEVTTELARAGSTFYRVELEKEVTRTGGERAVIMESDDQIRDWLIATVGIDYYSQKEVALVVGRVLKVAQKAFPSLAGKTCLVKHLLREKLAGLIEAETDRQTEATFADMHKKKRLCFFLECAHCRFEIPPAIELRSTRALTRTNGTPLQRSLFDTVEDSLNELERDIALYLDDHPQVLWWYRNLVGRNNFAIQGFRRDLIYPDFVVQESTASKTPKAAEQVLVIEGKGPQLKGSDDTEYKRRVANYFTQLGKKVPWHELASGFSEQKFRFQVLDQGDYEGQEWRDTLRKMFSAR